MKTLIVSILLVSNFAFAIKPVPPSYTFIAKTAKGLQLRLEEGWSPEGGSYVQYEIVGKKNRVLKQFPISDTQFDAHALKGTVHSEKISETTCRDNLKALEAELKKLKFKKVKVQPDECAKDRKKSIS